MLKDKRRFWTFLEWVAEKPHLREGLVKTGWASWENKWREEIYKKTLKPTGRHPQDGHGVGRGLAAVAGRYGCQC